MKKIKTNAMRKLDKEKIPYIFHSYIIRPKITLQELSSDIGKDPHLIFKTLVTVSPDQSYYVFCLPLEDELDLKKAAKVANVKSLSMIDQNNLLTLTGYERGGVSPLGMKKSFPTY
ncbi:MAG: Cys-tRNA(Pro) deacylase, partial [Clostridium sp.]|nr:Cys-tRNA(Pro) deacylase [Clostridium sp.]